MALFFFCPLPHDSHFDLFSLCIKSIDLELNRSSEGIKYRNSGVRSGTTKIDVRRSHLISPRFFFWFSAFAIRLQLWPTSIVLPRATQLAWSNNKLKDQIAHDGVSVSIASLPPHPTVRICHVDRFRHFSWGIKPTLLSLFCTSTQQSIDNSTSACTSLASSHLASSSIHLKGNAIQTFVLL